jgi:hypothetical protein
MINERIIEIWSEKQPTILSIITSNIKPPIDRDKQIPVVFILFGSFHRNDSLNNENFHKQSVNYHETLRNPPQSHNLWTVNFSTFLSEIPQISINKIQNTTHKLRPHQESKESEWKKDAPKGNDEKKLYSN